MGNPLLGEETGQPARFAYQRKQQQFQPVANNSDSFLMPSERAPAAGGSFGYQSSIITEPGQSSPGARSAIPTWRPHIDTPVALPRARTLDPELHPREISSRPLRRGDVANEPANRTKTDVTGWSYDTHWTVPAAMLPQGEPSLNPTVPKQSSAGGMFSRKPPPDNSSRPAGHHPRSTYVEDQVWKPAGKEVKYGKSPGNPLGDVTAPAAPTSFPTSSARGDFTAAAAGHTALSQSGPRELLMPAGTSRREISQHSLW